MSICYGKVACCDPPLSPTPTTKNKKKEYFFVPFIKKN